MDLWSEIGDLVWLPVSAPEISAIDSEHADLIAAFRARDAGRAREVAERHVCAETDRMLALRLTLVRGDRH
jgi:DNA-binding GntR family transcriptional regulator